MTEWEIVLALAVLVSLLATIVKPIIILTKSITTLTSAVEGLKEDLEGITANNKESHQRLWDHNDDQDKALQNHEMRITVIEKEVMENEN